MAVRFPYISNRVARKALTNLKQYTCERYQFVRGNSQEDSSGVAATFNKEGRQNYVRKYAGIPDDIRKTL